MSTYKGYTETQARAGAKYDKTHTVQYKIKLNIKTDADIIARLNAQENKQGYIKNLIRSDMAREMLNTGV